jgi:hypothetical protein
MHTPCSPILKQKLQSSNDDGKRTDSDVNVGIAGRMPWLNGHGGVRGEQRGVGGHGCWRELTDFGACEGGSMR